MDCKWFWVFLVMIFVSSGEGCWEEERTALLQLKHFFSDPNGYLYNWVENSECCKWERVECNNITGRVIKLDFSYTREEKLGEWYLNASLFSPFQQLHSLDLNYNNIAGCIENEGFEKLSRLSNLEELSLRANKFNNNILSSLVSLSSLKYLDLYDNRLKGAVNIGGLHTLKKLDMSRNEIDQFVGPKDYRDLKKLNVLYLRDIEIIDASVFLQSTLKSFPSLKTLDLSYNSFNRTMTTLDLHNLTTLEELYLDGSKVHISFLQSIATCTSLKHLLMWNCEVNGISQVQDLHNLITLEELNLDGSKFHISFLQFIATCISLKHLSMSGCEVNGISQVQDFHNLTTLEELYLDGSKFHISFLQSVATFTSLKHLSMSHCEVNGISQAQGPINFKNLESLIMDGTTFNTSFGQIIRPINTLKELSLWDCGLNGTLHDQGLCEMVHLEELYIGNNALRDTLPPCLANLTSIRVLEISNNLLQIPISLAPLYNLSKLKEFQSENNQIYAETMTHSLTPKFQLKSITLSGYGYDATFPRFLYHQYDLHKADLSHIKLSEEFPNWLIENNTKLETLHLSNNSLSGPFLLPIHPHMNLTTLDISNNFFNGQIPIEVGVYLPRLTSLNISKNALNGSIPSSFGDMSLLQSLDLSNNRLSGEIPEHLTIGCFSLELLVLSNNSLEGPIFSKKFNLTNLMRLQLDGNNFIGKIPEVLSNCSSLGGLYFSDNRLTGGIPRWLGNLSMLQDIIMPNNHLKGPIPTELCQLENLQVLDLSNNSIFGSLPSCSSVLFIEQLHLSRNMLQGHLNNLFLYSPFLVTLDLSYNNLYGSIANWIDNLSSLNYLILNNNNFEGEVPTHLCKLNQLRLIDLSHNQFFGKIPFCLVFTALDGEDDDAKAPSSGSWDLPPASSPVVFSPSSGPPMGKEETVEFTTKNNSYFYEGKILTYMFGIDLSCNKLTGEIPYQIGYLARIHTLNLSHNNLTGSIPMTFSHLQHIESLDLSYNNLNGKIPPQLVGIYTLSFFSVAHNNLSGKTPEMINQFGTFGESSYEGNPLLCGPPLPKCDANGSSSSMPRASIENKGDNNFIDVEIFYISFTVSYIIVLLGIATILYINPYWRRAWFYHVEMWTTSSYYFVVDHLPKPLRLRSM